jgi:MFS transporter, DHA1 family, multidrug resistance protein
VIFVVIIFSIFVAGAEIDIAMPSLPAMKEYFRVSTFLIELVLAVNVVCHCVAALFAGFLGDKYGKKQIIVYGFILFIIGSFLCAISSNFYFLLIGRAIQGIGVAPAMVLSFIIGLEKYAHKGEDRVLAFLNGFATISVCVAPLMGSYVNLYFGWRGNFWLLFVFGILSLLSFYAIIPNDKIYKKNISLNILHYITLLKNKIILLYLISACLIIGAYYSFVAIAPILYMESLGVSLKNFGFYQGVLTLTFGIFSISNGLIINLIGRKNTFLFSLFLILAFIVSNIFITAINIQNPIVITGVMLLLSIGFVFPCNVLISLALNTDPEAKGRVSALISTFKWIFAVIGVQCASFFYMQNYLSLGITISTMIFLSVLISYILWRSDPRLKKSFLVN